MEGAFSEVYSSVFSFGIFFFAVFPSLCILDGFSEEMGYIFGEIGEEKAVNSKKRN